MSVLPVDTGTKDSKSTRPARSIVGLLSLYHATLLATKSQIARPGPSPQQQLMGTSRMTSQMPQSDIFPQTQFFSPRLLTQVDGSITSLGTKLATWGLTLALKFHMQSKPRSRPLYPFPKPPSSRAAPLGRRGGVLVAWLGVGSQNQTDLGLKPALPLTHCVASVSFL